MAIWPTESYNASRLRQICAEIEATAREGRTSVAQILTEQRLDMDGCLRLAVVNSDVEMVAFLLQDEWTSVLPNGIGRDLERASMVKLCIASFGGTEGAYSYACVRMARLLADAGADLSRPIPLTPPNEESCLETMVRLKAQETTSENFRKMQFLHHVLLRREGGVRSASWLWPAMPVAPAAPADPATSAEPAPSAPHTMAVRRARGPAVTSRSVLGGMFR